MVKTNIVFIIIRVKANDDSNLKYTNGFNLRGKKGLDHSQGIFLNELTILLIFAIMEVIVYFDSFVNQKITPYQSS